MKTPLYEIHQRPGARLIDFHGFEMPVQYTSITEEHLAVRKAAGIFDLSHMGEIEVQGKDALKFIQGLITNDAEKLSDGKVLYTPLCNTKGGIIDDIILYRFNKERFLLVVNASNIEKDYNWVLINSLFYSGGARVLNRSQELGMVAVQGPASPSIIEKALSKDMANLPHHSFVEQGDLIVSRTGYTGEDGFEVYAPNDKCPQLWEKFMNAGKTQGIKPVGLGARDTLRLEAGLLLYGNDMEDSTTPLEAGIEWTVKFYKEDFIGKAPLLAQKASGVKKTLVGLELLERGIPRNGHSILADSNKIGYVTSGTFSPYLQKPIAMGYVETSYLPEKWQEGAQPTKELFIEIREKKLKARLIRLPFYKRF